MANTKINSSCLKFIAIGIFFVYVAWNLYWLAQGRLAPSMLLGFTGIPAPTTGMTRSFMAFTRLDFALCLSYNPFTFPTIALIISSFIVFFKRYALGEKVLLNAFILWSWFLVLSASWIYQIVIL